MYFFNCRNLNKIGYETEFLLYRYNLYNLGRFCRGQFSNSGSFIVIISSGNFTSISVCWRGPPGRSGRSQGPGPGPRVGPGQGNYILNGNSEHVAHV